VSRLREPGEAAPDGRDVVPGGIVFEKPGVAERVLGVGPGDVEMGVLCEHLAKLALGGLLRLESMIEAHQLGLLEGGEPAQQRCDLGLEIASGFEQGPRALGDAACLGLGRSRRRSGGALRARTRER